MFVIIGAANRDPDVFTDPDRLDLGRTADRHLTFSGGPHFCLGAAARTPRRTDRVHHDASALSKLELETEEPEWRETFTLRGLKQLPLMIES